MWTFSSCYFTQLTNWLQNRLYYIADRMSTENRGESILCYNMTQVPATGPGRCVCYGARRLLPGALALHAEFKTHRACVIQSDVGFGASLLANLKVYH